MIKDKILTQLDKLWNKIKKNYYILITLLEVIIFLMGILFICSFQRVDYIYEDGDIILNSDGVENYGNIIVGVTEGNHFFVTPSVMLDKGIYQIKVLYKTDADNNNCSIVSSSTGAYSIFSDYFTLSAMKSSCEFNIWVNNKLDTMQVKVGYVNTGTLEVQKIEISTAWNSYIYQIFKLLCGLILVNLLCYLWLYRDKVDWVVIIGILGSAILASCGLFGEYYQWGHDIDFHLVRIEGLKDGLLSGAFPVRIQPNWVNGYGYAVAVMYGNSTLLLPALLRIIGVTVQDAYKCFVFAINLGTAISAYYCFKKISKNKNVGLVSSIIYTLSVYRMCDIYIRAAVGEFTAMMFLPLIVLGFYYAFAEDSKQEDYGKHLWQPVLGFSGLIQSHILSCQMVAVFIVLLCLICIKKVFEKRTFIYLCKIAGLTLLVNLWFLVPFMQYMGEDLNVVATEFNGNIQRRGITIMELFAPIYNGNVIQGGHWDTLLDIGGKFPVSLGSVFLIIGAIYLISCNKWKENRIKTTASVTFLLLGVSVFLSTNLFPYNDINSFSETLAKLIGRGNLPFRYLSISGVLGATLGCLLLIELNKQWSKEYVKILAVGLCLVAAIQSTSYTYEVLFRGGMSIKYDEGTLSTENLMGDEYVYVGSSAWSALQDAEAHGYNMEIFSYKKNYNTIIIEGKATGDNPSVIVPLFYYIGYEANDVYTNERFEIIRSQDNNRICVNLPNDYEGTLIIRFSGLWYWHVAEIISLLAVIVLIVSQMGIKRYYICRDRVITIACKLVESIKQKKVQEKRVEVTTKKEPKQEHQHVIFTSVRLWNIIITCVVFGIILVLNFHTDYVSDDFHYHFFFDTAENPTNLSHRMRFWEVVSSMMNHWKLWNGRMVAHGALQLVLGLGKIGFKIFNSIMFILLGTLIYKHSMYGKKESISLLVLIYVCMWFFLPQFGLTILWASGAANYLWTSVLILGFAFIYRVHLVNQSKIKDITRNTVIMTLFGFLAGCTNENSGGAVVLLCLMFLGLYRYYKLSVPKWALSGIGGSVVGCIVLIRSPGNYRVSSKTDLQGLYNRWKDVLSISKREITILIVILCIVALMYIALMKMDEVKGSGRWLPLIYFLVGGASICVLIFSASYPERAWFIGTVFFIVVVGYLYDEILYLPKLLYGALTVILIFAFSISFRTEYPKIEATYEQVKEGIDLIEQAKQNGEKVVSIPMVQASDSKYDAFNGTGYIREASDDWLNAWMAKYYEMDAIYGYQRSQE